MIVGFDSCAAVSMLPQELFKDYPLKRDGGAKFRSASNHPIIDQGSRGLVGHLGGSKLARGIRFRVGGIRKPLLCAAEMVDAGYRVVLDQDNGIDKSHMINKKTGEVSSLVRSGKIYNMEMDVLPYAKAVEIERKFQKPRVGFQRQGFQGKGWRQSP